ncbi:aminodeoxychorismate synthase component I [Chryseobacterium manosquense]|uniref:Aminodeoxychorismate synthase component I n=1 Tax=Chryseobacterium manosquense TaxID=2754694 RepID=A0A7H1DUT6_9FLAO|nr:aminodeoxychorismate synthase component I [Chryseobacterium manosquense]QNS40744.1 aminodeoxychorismate synthase component I [Chryseobacterium manosquense]
MNSSFHQNFDLMDELSQKKVPFFFMIDFLMENVEIFTENEIEKTGLKIDIKGFKTDINEQEFPREIIFESFPPSEDSYKKGFDIVQNHLKKGNSYLVNYTCKTEIKTNLSLENLYQISQAKYKVLYPENWMFFSPETFIEIIDNEVFTYPMKGTIDAEIENAADILKNNEKEKAEHYTVVDLLRNDLSMIADDVKLDEFQKIDFLKTRQKNLLAMSSKISGKLKPEFKGKIGSIMKTVLPAGSVLGSPKPKTLEIILEAENYSRGFYTGVCGWFDGENLDSCVIIRFIEKENDKLYFKSGGGITHLSNFADEYQEMKNKIYVPIY